VYSSGEYAYEYDVVNKFCVILLAQDGITWSKKPSDHAEDSCKSGCFWSERTCMWLLTVTMAMILRASFLRSEAWSKQQLSLPWRLNPQPQQLQDQQQQLMQHKLPLQAQSPAKSATKWLKKLLFVFVMLMLLVSIWLFHHIYRDTVLRRKETLANMCDERARMLQDQFNVSLNHVHALAILVSTFHHGKYPSAMDQVIFTFFKILQLFILAISNYQNQANIL